ncbi:hypothetical protein R1flu_025057 [Riccia fluitans]|uniref:Uncharacterized protein n=1 Tax=Riccia fluitans TaxID=41844 RepID=A0ABD1XWN3_9MARC
MNDLPTRSPRDVLGRPCQTIAQNDACLVSLESSQEMLSNDTKNTMSPFIDQKLCKFARLGRQQTFANASKAFASGGKFPPGEFDLRRFGAPRPNGSSE